MTDRRLRGTVAIEEIGPQCSRDSRDGGSLLPGAGVGHDRREAASPNPGSWGAYEGSPGCGSVLVNKAHARTQTHTRTRQRAHAHAYTHICARTHARMCCSHCAGRGHTSRRAAWKSRVRCWGSRPGRWPAPGKRQPSCPCGLQVSPCIATEAVNFCRRWQCWGDTEVRAAAGDAVMISWSLGLNL